MVVNRGLIASTKKKKANGSVTITTTMNNPALRIQTVNGTSSAMTVRSRLCVEATHVAVLDCGIYDTLDSCGAAAQSHNCIWNKDEECSYPFCGSLGASSSCHEYGNCRMLETRCVPYSETPTCHDLPSNVPPRIFDVTIEQEYEGDPCRWWAVCEQGHRTGIQA